LTTGLMNPSCRFTVAFCLLLAALPLAAQVPDQLKPKHVGRVSDWSYRHIIFSGGASPANLEAARTEPRILFHMAERNLLPIHDGVRSFPIARGPEYRIPPTPISRPKILDGGNVNKMKKRNLKIDWSLSLGTGNVPQSMFPAKYSFNINATPSCANDYVVYGLNVAGVTGGQANLVGVNNLYSGSSPAGLCGTVATINWAYNGSTAAGSVLTSTTISLDGTKIAYVESASGSAVFHILTWVAGQGTSATSAVAPTLSGSCTASTSCLASVTYSTTATTSLASPWVDYQTDKAFVGGDDGKIYRISCVFTCALNTQPTVDWTFTLPVAGTGGALPVPDGPVYDYPSGRLFVGDQLGELWVINAGGSTPTLNAGPVMIGGGGCTTAHPPGRTGTGADCTATGTAYGIPDSVIMDSSGVSQSIFALSGNDGTTGASAVIAQLKMNLTGEVAVPIGLGGVNLYTGAFDNGYWGTTPSTGELFVCGTGPSDTTPTHYWIGFTSYPTMNSTSTGNKQREAVAGVPCTPYTEFYNPNLSLGGNSGDHDLLMSGLIAAGANGYIITDDISSGTVIAGLNDVNYTGGISAIVVDNVSTQNQASSMYFTTLTNSTVGTCGGTRCAVKLRQLNLQ
jgi:hypothetical protein